MIPALLDTAAAIAGACAGDLGRAAAILFFVAALASLPGRPPGSAWRFGLAVAAAMTGAWMLRDRLYLVSDQLFWLHSVESMGADLPVFRAPLGAKTLAWISTLSGIDAAVALPLVSILCGGFLAWMLRRLLLAEGRAVSGAVWIPVALAFLQPPSFVFYGHIETYPLFAALLALFFVMADRDFAAGRLRFATLFVFSLMAATHLLGILVAVAFAAWWAVGRVRRRWIAVAALAAVALVVAIAPLREHTNAFRPWTPAALLSYAAGLGGTYALLFVPAGVPLAAALRGGGRGGPGGFTGFAGIVFALFASLPVVAHFELGLYRDLDLMTPAFTALAFFTAGVLRDRPPGRWSRVLLAGPILLAPLLVLGTCAPAGERAFARALDDPALLPRHRSFGYELLAFRLREGGRPAEAVGAMETAVALQPGNLRLRGTLGEAQLAAGDTAAGAANLRRALDSTLWPRAAAELAELYVRRGEPERTVDLLEGRSGVYADSRLAAALCVAYTRVGMPESTLAVAARRGAVDPGDATAHFNRGSALFRLGRDEEAMRWLETAIAVSPDRVEFHRAYLAVLRVQPGGAERVDRYLHALPAFLRERLTGG